MFKKHAVYGLERLGACGPVKYNQSFLDGRSTLPAMRVCKFFA